MTEKTENTAAKAAPKAEKEVLKVGTNALTLPWPQDVQGALQSLKKGGVEAAKRVNGDKEKLKKLVQTLRIIEAHAKEKFALDAKAREDAKVNSVSAQLRIQEKLRRQAEARAEQYEAAAKREREAYAEPK